MRRLLVLLVALAATGCSTPVESAVDQGPSPRRTMEVSPGATLQAAQPDPVVPGDLHLWKFDAPVVPVPLESDGSLTPPDDPDVLGWWGRRAGATHGVTLLTGHTVHTGGGELDDLRLTPVGSVAHVSGFTYRVISVRVLPTSAVARRAEALFSQSGAPRLVIVTCSDYDWDTGVYLTSTVVTGKPI